MPLSEKDRRFLQAVDRLKVYVLLLALAVFVYLLVAPAGEIQMATSILGLALCGVFWLTQRLLTCISALDYELTSVVKSLKGLVQDDRGRS